VQQFSVSRFVPEMTMPATTSQVTPKNLIWLDKREFFNMFDFLIDRRSR
jgi:hypothetical protein